MTTAIRTGVLGYGLAGRCFHLPYLRALPQFDVRVVATTRPEAHAALPGVKIVPSVEEVLTAEDIDLVVIATPHRMHMPHALAALEAGKHVVIEKPAAVTSGEVETLKQAVATAGKLAIPFHNRRWDSDFQTVRQLVASGMLGTIHYFESRWVMFRPKPRGVWRDRPEELGGVFNDLGPHLIDQALQLFGIPESVFAQIMIHRPGCTVDDAFRVQMTYGSGLHIVLETDVLNGVSAPRFTLRGTNGAFEKHSVDPQEALLRAGIYPNDPAWNIAAEAGRIVLGGEHGLAIEGQLEIAPGDYRGFYAGVASAITSSAPAPVTLDELGRQVQVMEAARRSSASGIPEKVGRP